MLAREAIVQEVDENLPLEDENVPTQATDFFDEINRGGLWKPTAAIFNIGIFCWKIFAEISMTGLKQKFMSSDNHREVLKEIVNLAFYDGYVLSHWAVSSMCTNGHAIIEGLALRFFNCMCKNLIRNLSERDSHRNATKIKKLSGKRYAAQ